MRGVAGRQAAAAAAGGSETASAGLGGQVCAAGLPRSAKSLSAQHSAWTRHYLQVLGKETSILCVATCRGKVKVCQTLRLQLLRASDVAATCSAECPITMERFKDSEVDFLPGARVVRSKPELCVARLPCGHCAGAVPLMYHMLVSGMSCPLCRAGPGSKMSAACVPPHIRSEMVSRAQLISARDREVGASLALSGLSPPLSLSLTAPLRAFSVQDAENESRRVVRQMLLDMLSGDASESVDQLVVIQEGLSVTLTVYFYAARSLLPTVDRFGRQVHDGHVLNAQGDNIRRTVYTVQYPITTEDSYTYSLSPLDVSALSNSINDLGAAFIRMTVLARDFDDNLVSLSDTGIFDISHVSPAGQGDDLLRTFSIQGSPLDQFDIARERRSDGVNVVRSVVWASQSHIITRLVSR